MAALLLHKEIKEHDDLSPAEAIAPADQPAGAIEEPIVVDPADEPAGTTKQSFPIDSA